MSHFFVFFLWTQHTKGGAGDSELFVCPWDASVIVEAYQNLGAKNERRVGERKGEGVVAGKKYTWL